ncbi:translation initiation factor 1A [Striga asiatica]|uniref:Translation initiation factor 1A n=1 Tax=Striga asiatica TaxID=4170 RepID=A0A5A7PBZ0_STRAF|nr:translation initiation factor 1A [Striga asiatica]
MVAGGVCVGVKQKISTTPTAAIAKDSIPSPQFSPESSQRHASLPPPPPLTEIKNISPNGSQIIFYGCEREKNYEEKIVNSMDDQIFSCILAGISDELASQIFSVATDIKGAAKVKIRCFSSSNFTSRIFLHSFDFLMEDELAQYRKSSDAPLLEFIPKKKNL